MGIQNDLNVISNYRKTLFQLSVLTSIVAIAASVSTVDPPVMPLAVGNVLAEANAQTLVEKQQRPAIPYCNDEKHERTIGQR